MAMKSFIRGDSNLNRDRTTITANVARTNALEQPRPGSVSPSDVLDSKFKMCKKISELTMVVHLLFKKNHEGELTTRLLAEHYSELLEAAQKKHAEKVRKLEEELKITKEKLAQSQDPDLIIALKKCNHDLTDQIVELQAKVAEEKKINNQLQDSLANSTRDNTFLRNQLAQIAADRDTENDRKNMQIERLKQSVQNTERLLKEQQTVNEQQVSEFSAKMDEMQKRTLKLEDQCEEQLRTKEQLLTRNSQLVLELKHLRATMAHRLDAVKQVAKSAVSFDESTAEVGSLRNELLRYKMELKNREENYNRIFTQFNPMRVDKNPGKAQNERDSATAPPQPQPLGLKRLSSSTAMRDYERSDLERDGATKTDSQPPSGRSHNKHQATSQSALRTSQAYGFDMLDLGRSKADSAKLDFREVPTPKLSAPPPLPAHVHLSSLKSLLSRQKPSPGVSILRSGQIQS